MEHTKYDLEPGSYILESPIPNPDGDKRVSRDWTRCPYIPKGVYWVELDRSGVQNGYTVMKSIRMADGYRQAYQHVPHSTWHVIVPHLKPYQETPSEYLERIGVSLPQLIDDLVSSGRVTREELETLAARQRDND